MAIPKFNLREKTRVKRRETGPGYGDVPQYTEDEMRRIWAAGVSYGEKHPNDSNKVCDENFTQAFEEELTDISCETYFGEHLVSPSCPMEPVPVSYEMFIRMEKDGPEPGMRFCCEHHVPAQNEKAIMNLSAFLFGKHDPVAACNHVIRYCDSCVNDHRLAWLENYVIPDAPDTTN
jgi:hypothetical protein